jgi:hypothetical protein
LAAGDIVGGQCVNVTNDRIHNCRHVLASLIGMREAESVSKFVERDALNVERTGAQWPTIRIE